MFKPSTSALDLNRLLLFRIVIAFAVMSALILLLVTNGHSTNKVVKAHAANTAAVKQQMPVNKKSVNPMTTDYLHLPFTTITGDTTTLAAFKGKVVLIVNTASECGFTPQYAGLETLYERFKDSGLVIVGFPANNYGDQEPGSNTEIATFCSKTYHVTFPMMSKVSVDGPDKHPLFAYLTEQSSIPGPIKWNFSKFLINKEGQLVARFASKTEPDDAELVGAIEKLL